MGKHEIKNIVHWIDDAINSFDNIAKLTKIKTEINSLCESFPIYPHLAH